MQKLIELRARDGQTKVATITAEMQPNARLPDVIVWNNVAYHAETRGTVPVYAESEVFILNTEPAAEQPCKA